MKRTTRIKFAGALLLASAAAVSAQSLTTGDPNNGSGGVFLDLTATNAPLNVTSFEVAYSGTAGTDVDVEVWVRQGSYVGNETSSAGWTLTQTITGTRQGASEFSPLNLNTAIELPPGVTTGVYLQALSVDGVRYNGTATVPPQTTWQNADLTLYSEHATTAATAFSGSIFDPRTFSGVVHYEEAGPPALGLAMPIPEFESTFESSNLTRGMWFEAPADFVITGLRVPDEESHGLQNVEVVRLDAEPPTWASTTENFTSLARHTAISSETIIPVNIPVAKGDYIGILGAAGDSSMMYNSYGSVSFETTILGRTASLHRLGMQANLVTQEAQSLFTEASPIGRIEVFYKAALGAESLATAEANNGRSDSGAGVFFDLTPEHDITITGIDYVSMANSGAPVTVEVWTREGSYVGHEGSSAGWSLHESVDAISAGTSISTPVPLSKALELTANQTTGVYLIGAVGGIRYTGTSTNPPQTTFSDDNLTLSGEHARGGPPWEGTLFTPRTFSGAIHYTLGGASFVMPNEYASTVGQSGRNTLVRDLPRLVQFVVSASELSELDIGTPITGIAWRQWDGATVDWPPTDVRWDRYDIQVGTSANPPSSFSNTFADNVGPDNTMVRSGSLTIPAGSFPHAGSPTPFGQTIPFTTPFVYEGGDLVFTITHEGNDDSAAFLDSVATGAPGYGDRFAYIDTTNLSSATGSSATFPITQLQIVGDEEACYANCDGSTTEPVLTVNDFTCFINEFAQAQTLPTSEQINHYANCDGSTTAPVLTVNDFTCFINEFAQGCP